METGVGIWETEVKEIEGYKEGVLRGSGREGEGT